MSRRRKILFVGEGVTLAHVARPYLLASALDPDRYDAVLVIPEIYNKLFKNPAIRFETLRSIEPDRFLKALAKGAPVYDYATLKRYFEEDLSLLRREKPDLVVGDFRLSLSASAAIAGVKYAALTNAHWSPYAILRPWPIPEHFSTRLFGIRLSQSAFNLLLPRILSVHARPLDALRKEHGLPPFRDLRKTYTDADFTLYADTPNLIPTEGLPSNHYYLGPVIWSPDVALPDWWKDRDPTRTSIYITLGSSGKVEILPSILKALAPLPVDVLVATAGRFTFADLQPPVNCYLSDYLPGSRAAASARLVICNGGSATVYQALAEGCPVLGLPANLDQHLTMAHVERTGAGATIRSDGIAPAAIRDLAIRMLQQPRFSDGAAGVARDFRNHQCSQRFGDWLEARFN